jgi:raffinose/stachyose/melibiose transport system permease protein
MTADLRLRGASPGKVTLILLFEIVMFAYAILIFYPLLNMVISSLKTTREIFQHPFSLPTTLEAVNYRVVWIDKGFDRPMLQTVRGAGYRLDA